MSNAFPGPIKFCHQPSEELRSVEAAWEDADKEAELEVEKHIEDQSESIAGDLVKETPGEGICSSLRTITSTDILNHPEIIVVSDDSLDSDIDVVIVDYGKTAGEPLKVNSLPPFEFSFLLVSFISLIMSLQHSFKYRSIIKRAFTA